MITNRRKWQQQRQLMENNGVRATVLGPLRKTRFGLTRSLVIPLSQFLKLAYPLYLRGNKNALNIKVVANDHYFSTLPPAFDGLKILHLSDLHLDENPEITDRIITLVSGLTYDVCVFTGDYFSSHKNALEFMPLLKRIVEAINPGAKCYGVLGNHDSEKLTKPLEELGIHLLINENEFIKKDGQCLQLIGIDDVHEFFTQSALDAISNCRNYFTVVLAHSPELFDFAEREGANLYLCGHTHGGQIRLTKNTPLIKKLHCGHDFYSRRWRHKSMQGYTSHGAGTSAIPIRFHADAEICLHTLNLDSSG